jgi:hypothetical protein
MGMTDYVMMSAAVEKQIYSPVEAIPVGANPDTSSGTRMSGGKGYGGLSWRRNERLSCGVEEIA